MNPVAFPDPTNIQGNLVGFLKDHQRFGFFRIDNPDAAKQWLRSEACDNVATADEVRQFNNLFKRLRDRRGGSEIVKATWMNLALSAGGLRKLGLAQNTLAAMDPAFQTEIVQHAGQALGDAGDSAPTNWHEPYRNGSIDLVIIVASDDPDDLQEHFERYTADAESNGLSQLFVEHGEARTDRAGHEHFGFKDGVSQPKIAGIDDGENLLDASLFIVNATLPPPVSQPGVYTPPAPQPAPSGPRWDHEGAYLVFRKLRQRVPEFAAFVRDQTPPHLDASGFASKLVGRDEDGRPLEKIPTLPAYDYQRLDPSSDVATQAKSAPFNNAFSFDDDPNGINTPLASHIRKSNPRTVDKARVRILRRGIAYGRPYDEDAPHSSDASAAADRGLLFASYQASIAQFETLQQTWANDPNFPQPSSGHDPIIGQNGGADRTFSLPSATGTLPYPSIKPFVVTMGTVYLFSPSITALRNIGV